MLRNLLTDVTTLHRPSGKVTIKRGLATGRELFKFLEKYNKDFPHRQGLGLAAPQLGIFEQVCILLFQPRLVLINPEIIERSQEEFVSNEGCLSLPNIKLDVMRSIWVRVIADNWKTPRVFGVDLSRVTGKTYEQMALESACVQHECQHLQGILITDLAK